MIDQPAVTTGRSTLDSINKKTVVSGLLWDKISLFREQLTQVEGSISSHTEEMEDFMPLEHHFGDDGLYTRKIFMPLGALVVSYIHKQAHPSFLLEGDISVLQDNGEVKRLKAPCIIQTEVGTQRVFYIHSDTVFTCVYKTNKKTVAEAEAELYTLNYKDLPIEVINNRINGTQKHKLS